MYGGVEMKKILMCVFSLLFSVGALAAPTKMYVDTEQKYIFTAENVATTVPEFIEDVQKQNAVVDTWQSVMDQETGAVSVANLFEICRAGGFNTYRQSGFEECRTFVSKLLENAELEAEEGIFGGFCPGLDENGKNPNALSSITDKTMIGDFCSSTNIAAGEVVFRKGYNCTCAAYACNAGFESKGGACVTRIADSNGNCLRKEYDGSPKSGESLKFCESKAVQGCKIVNAIRNFPKAGKVTCNATQAELNKNTPCQTMAYPETAENNYAAKCESFCKTQAQANSCKYKSYLMQHSTKQCICNPGERELSSSNLYKEVCGKDKGKTGKTEYCIDDFFNWTQTQIGQAVGFSKDYAKIKNGHTVTCSDKYRKSGNDDFVACVTSDSKVYYEFKFDDITESFDVQRRESERKALCKLVGGDGLKNLTMNESLEKTLKLNWKIELIVEAATVDTVCKVSSESACKKLIDLSKKYGYRVVWAGNQCIFVDGNHSSAVLTQEKFEESLAKIPGLDNYKFKNVQVIRRRANFNLMDEIERYVKQNVPGATNITCDPGYNTVKTVAEMTVMQIAVADAMGDAMDVLRCYVNKKPIDFVFDDLSESWGKDRDAGEQGAKCIGRDGNFDGHYCRGLTKQECFDLEKALAEELKTKGWAGDGDLVDWDESAQACELNAAQFANNTNKVGKYTAIAGLTVAGVFTGGTTTAAAISLMAVELAGIAGEITVEREKELLPQKWADQFLASSINCQEPSCAERTLRNNFGKISQASDMLNRDVLKQVDDELARLAELLPDERLAEIMNNPEAPNCWETLECQEKIFIVMQMASLTTAVSKGLVNFTRVIARRVGTVTKGSSKALVNVAEHSDDIAKSTTKSLKEEFAEINVSEGKAYQDIKTGKFLSQDEVLKRIDDMPGGTGAKKTFKEELEEIGIKEYDTYRDIPSNRFISQNEVLRRIDGMGNAASDMVETAGSGAKVIETGKTAQRTAEAGKVADAELKAQREALAGVLADVERHAEKIEEVSILGSASVKNANKIDDVADVAKGARTANKAEPVVMSASKAEAANVAILRQSASKNFDTYLSEAKNSITGKGSKLPKNRLNDAGWNEVNKSLASDNVQLVDTGDGYMQFVRGDRFDDVADVAKGASKGGKAAEAERAAQRVAEAERAAQRVAEAERARKIEQAREFDNLGYHGTDADISMTDKIRPSANTSGGLGNVGFGIAKNYDDAERYAIRRLIERQNIGKKINFSFKNGVFEVTSAEPLNLSNKTGYIYTTAKESNLQWKTLNMSHSKNIDSPAAQMPNAVEILDKSAFNLDDLIRTGKVRILAP